MKDRPTGRGRYLRRVLVCAVAALSAPAAANAAISGTVFRDYDADGMRDAREPGTADVRVNAINDAGTVVATATTAGDGTYTLNGVTPGARVRLEFSGQAAYLKQGGNGTGAGSNVIFAVDGDVAVNHGVNNPAEFCEANPQIATACQFFGRYDGAFGTKAGMRVFGYNASGFASERTNPASDPTLAPTSASFAQIGSTFGLAYQRESRSMFAAAFYKRASGFGPSGPGAIYRITPGHDNAFGTADDVTTTFLDLGAAAGVDVHPNVPTTDPLWETDEASWPKIGKSSLGGIELSDDGQTLYVMNLEDRKLYVVPIGTTPAAPAPGAIRVVDVPDPGAGCVADPATPVGEMNLNVRPFAVGYQDGAAYVGLTCTGESTQQMSDVKAFVYRFDDPGFTRVLDIPLDFARTGSDMGWYPWSDATVGPTVTDWVHGEPMLSDLEWDGEDLLLGFRDRRSDQGGYGLGSFDGMSNMWNTAAGDLLRACREDAASESYLLESNGASQTGCRRAFASATGTGNTQGPGGGEFYMDAAAGYHEDTSMGGIAQVPGSSDVIAGIVDSNQISSTDGYVDSSGVRRMSNVDGSAIQALELTANCGSAMACRTNEAGGFGKSNGLGDLEALCQSAPIEIGNRVWLDDGDGVQDPSESAVAGATVHLYDAADNMVATTTTDAEGRWVFSSAGPDMIPGTADDLGGYGADLLPNTADDVAGLKPSQSYSVRLDNPADYTGTGPLASTVATAAGVTQASGLRISADDVNVTSATYGRASVTTGRAGVKNYTLDFGFVVRASVGDRVWYDTDKDGIQDAGERGVRGVRVFLKDTTGTEIARTTTDVNGNYLFTDLDAGDYVVVFDTTTLPSGYRVTTQAASGSTAGNGSDANGTTGATSTITLTSGESDLTWDMGISAATAAKLSITKQTRTTRAHPGQQVSFVLRVKNTGTATATGVSVCDRLPSRMTFVSVPVDGKIVKGALCFSIKSLTPGATRSYTVKVLIASVEMTGSLTNTATVTAGNVVGTATATARVRVSGAVLGRGVPGVTG